MFLTPSSTPCWTIERSPKIKKRAPRCMGTLRQKTERAPRCMGTLFVLSWSSWVPPRAPQAIAPNIHFQTSFCNCCSSGSTCWPLPACTQVENMQYHIGFIHVFDAVTESMLDHRKVTPKSKNERRAAWERSGVKKNERHAAWERSGKKMVAQEASPRDAPSQVK